MSMFRDQVYNWNGADYPIPASRVMKAIGVVEEVITLPEILGMKAHGPKLVKLSEAFAGVLNFAAALPENRALNLAFVTPEAVYLGVFGSEDKQKAVGEAISTLTMMMVPPSVIEKMIKDAPKEGAADATPGNVPAKNRKARRRAGSSKKPSR